MTKFYFYRRSVNSIKKVNVCCHDNNFFIATKVFTNPVYLTAYVRQISTSRPGGVSLISRHATDQNILLIFARHFLQSFNLEGSKGHIICGCAQDYSCLCNCFFLILCLLEGEVICFILYPSPNATLFCDRQELKLGHCHMMFVV